MSNVSEMSLLSILQREDIALKGIRWAGRWLEEDRARQMEAKEEYMKQMLEEVCRKDADKRDEWLQELNEARSDMKEYFRHFGIVRQD